MSLFCHALVMTLLVASVQWGFAQEPQEPSLPYVPSSVTDFEGNEWLIEQNGTIQPSGSDSMIGNCMSLHFGNQQFYTQQALTTFDGQEIVMPNTQAVAGVRITRRIYRIKDQSALLYVEEFHNITPHDLTFSFELRHHLRNQAREITSNTGRLIQDSLESEESGLFAIPGDADKDAPALLFMMRTASAASTAMKVRVENKYQISIPQSIPIPAGQVRAFVHGIAQIRSNAKKTKVSISQNTASFALDRYIERLPKAILKQSLNLGDSSDPWNLAQWLPQTFWGIVPLASDQLLVGRNSILKGQAKLQNLKMTRPNGRQIIIEPSLVAAIAGREFTGTNTSWVYLRDGQRWKGHLEADKITFSLFGGTDIPLHVLDRLVLTQASPGAQNVTSKLSHSLIELKSGERIAIEPQGELLIETAWGPQTIPWSEIVAMKEAKPEEFGHLLIVKNGSKLRIIQPNKISVNTLHLGALELEGTTIHSAITPLAEQYTDADLKPNESYMEMVDGQRLVGRITNPSITIRSKAGTVSVYPQSIHEMHRLPDQNFEESENEFTLKLWAGGIVEGVVQEEMIHIQSGGYSLEIPTWQIIRIVHPAPKAEAELLRKIAAWIHDLGSEDWKTRESATNALRELGDLAQASLRDAQRQTKDAETSRRLEELLEMKN